VDKVKLKIAQRNNLKIELDEEEQKEKNLVSQINTLKEKKNKLDKAIYQLQSSNVLLQTQIDNNIKHISKHSEVLDIVCSNCKVLIENKYDIKNLKITNDATDNKIQDNLNKINKLQQTLKSIIDNIVSSKNIENKVQELDAHITKNKWIYNHLDTDIKELSNKIIEVKSQKSQFDTLINECVDKIKVKNVSLSELYNTKKYLDAVEFIVSEDGVKKILIKDLVDLLNNLIHIYLEQMGTEYTCIFDYNFDVKFVTSTGICEYNNFSAGERKRINIATLFAFNDILNSGGSVDSNIFIIDEILDENIDTYAIQSLVDILDKQAKIKEQTIYLISHREAFNEDLFDNVVELEKYNGMTKIVRDLQNDTLSQSNK
jgi:DNA repair exonuclease SbcCD ATPase subunit